MFETVSANEGETGIKKNAKKYPIPIQKWIGIFSLQIFNVIIFVSALL